MRSVTCADVGSTLKSENRRRPRWGNSLPLSSTMRTAAGWALRSFASSSASVSSRPALVFQALASFGSAFVAGFVLSLIAAALGILPEMPQ